MMFPALWLAYCFLPPTQPFQTASQPTEHVREMRSPLAVHHRYSRSHGGLPVLDRRPKFARYAHDGKTRLAQRDFEAVVFPQFPTVGPEKVELALRRFAERGPSMRLASQSRYYLVDKGRVTPVLRLVLQGESPIERLYLDLDARSMQELSRFNPILTAGTEGRGQVWRHNPVAASREHSTDTGLVEVPLRGLDGSGYLRGQYADVTDPIFNQVDPEWASRYWPDYRPGLAHEPSQVFKYEPADLRFEEVSAYYWIDTAQRHLQSLGFHIFERPIDVAVHGFEGSNAAFNTETKILVFGDGYTDTAEDASVVTHEYGHAILDDIVGAYFFDEAGAMFHEGFADFFSYAIARAAAPEVGPDRYPQFLGEWFASYASTSPPYLRSLDQPGFRHPFLTGEPHEDGRLWSSAFFEMAQSFGDTVALSLVLESLYLVSSAQPAEIVSALLEIDRTQYQGQYAARILDIMRKRGLYEPERDAPITELLLGDSLQFTDQRSLIHFTVPAQGSFRLRAQPQTGFMNDALVFMASGRLPSFLDYDKVAWDYQEWDWVHDPSSRPALAPGDDIYLFVDVLGTFTFALEAAEPSPPRPLASHEPVELSLAPGTVKTFRLDDLSSFAYLVVQTQFEGECYAFLASERPLTSADRSADPALVGVIKGSDYLVFDLEPFKDQDILFLTVEATDADAMGTLSWQGSIRPYVQPGLQAGEQTVTLGQDWENTWSFELDQPAPGMTISATVPFTMTARHPSGGYRDIVDSTGHGDHHAIAVDPEYWAIPANLTQNWLGSYTGTGTYELRFSGAPGTAANVRITLQKPPPGLEIAEGARVQGELGPHRLVHYRFMMPADAKDIRLSHSPLSATQKLGVFIHNQPAPNSNRLTWSGDLVADATLFRVTPPMVQVPDFNILEPVFRPGEYYELWLYNDTDTPHALDFTIGFAREHHVGQLVDGQILDFHYDPEIVYLSQSWRLPLMVSPPPGTQRVRFQFQHLSGSRNAGLNLPTGRLRMLSSLMTDFEISARELDKPLDQPFLVFFGGDRHHEPDPPVYRVQLTFLSDSPFQAKLSGQATAAGTLVTWGGWNAAIEAPGARALDLMWRPSRHNLDAWVNLVVGPGLAVPFDLGLVTDRFYGGRKDYLLAAPTPYVALPQEDYAVSLGMEKSYRYLVGYVEGAEPFRFEFGVRPRSLQARQEHVTPVAVGSAQTARAWRRYINPGSVPVALDTTADGQPQSAQIAGFGFLDLPAGPGTHATVAADGPLALAEAMQGPGFLTTAMAPAYSEPNFWLPHVSPDASAWTSYLVASQAGATMPLLQGPGADNQAVVLGAPAPLANQANLASYRKLETGTPSGQAFPEDTLSACQYWQNGQQLAAEVPPTFASRTYFVPHLPDNPAWWSGLTLSNPEPTAVQVSVRAYGPTGKPEAVAFTLEAGASKVGLMDLYLPSNQTSQALHWLRIDASAPILAMAFMGGLHVGDSAGLLLPTQDGTTLILPGNLVGGPFGVALTNTVDQPGSCLVVARDANGAPLAQLTLDFQSHERKLLTQADFPGGQAYIVTVHSESLRLVGMQLDLDQAGGLAATAAQVVQ